MRFGSISGVGSTGSIVSPNNNRKKHSVAQLETSIIPLKARMDGRIDCGK